MTTQKSPLKLVVGIGASAGGLTALKELMPVLPVDQGIAYIALLHMDPSHPSQLDQILSKSTSLNIQTIENKAAIISNTFYIVPSDKSCTVKDGIFHLESISQRVGPRHSIDNLFHSLADEFSKHCIGIILSGTGSDGLHGCKAIKAHEGVVLVQDLTTAK